MHACISQCQPFYHCLKPFVNPHSRTPFFNSWLVTFPLTARPFTVQSPVFAIGVCEYRAWLSTLVVQCMQWDAPCKSTAGTAWQSARLSHQWFVTWNNTVQCCCSIDLHVYIMCVRCVCDCVIVACTFYLIAAVISDVFPSFFRFSVFSIVSRSNVRSQSCHILLVSCLLLLFLLLFCCCTCLLSVCVSGAPFAARFPCVFSITKTDPKKCLTQW